MALWLLNLEFREIPKTASRGKAELKALSTISETIRRTGLRLGDQAQGSETEAGRSNGYRRKRQDLPKDLEGLWAAACTVSDTGDHTWQDNNVMSTDANLSCWHLGATECYLIREATHATASHPCLGEAGSQGGEIRNQPSILSFTWSPSNLEKSATGHTAAPADWQGPGLEHASARGNEPRSVTENCLSCRNVKL